METPASCMDIGALDDAIYKLCDLRNSTAFQIANANWAELAYFDECVPSFSWKPEILLSRSFNY